jgi:hypothetical protein
MLAQDAGNELVALVDCEAGYAEDVAGRLLVGWLLQLAPVDAGILRAPESRARGGASSHRHRHLPVDERGPVLSLRRTPRRPARAQPARRARFCPASRAAPNPHTKAPAVPPRASRDPHTESPREAYRLPPAQRHFGVACRVDGTLAQATLDLFLRVTSRFTATASCSGRSMQADRSGRRSRG